MRAAVWSLLEYGRMEWSCRMKEEWIVVRAAKAHGEKYKG